MSIAIPIIELLLAGIMGFAIQRGATCLVVAVDQLVRERRARRLRHIAEASLWVMLGLLLAHAAGVPMVLPHGYVVGLPTVVGGTVLGLGAYINRGCVFGAIARLGSGEWVYLLTPVGFFVGCWVIAPWLPTLTPRSVAPIVPSMRVALALGAILSMALLWRVAVVARGSATNTSEPSQAWHRRAWQPGAATVVIGISFLGLFLLAGSWAYTDVLAELARGQSSNLAMRAALMGALIAGAIVGGWTAGRWHSVKPTALSVTRCLIGSAAMGVGGMLIPGGNDGLLLVGMPLLWPYAWLAVGVMIATIAGAQMLSTPLLSKSG